VSKQLSIIIPTLNEAEHIEANLWRLQGLRRQGHEIIVVDGGSRDATTRLAEALCDCLCHAAPGRARQMNEGARHACGNYLLFLHADTHLPDAAATLISSALHTHAWGRFDVRLSGRRWPLRVIEFMINLRSRLSGIATGDQALFMRRGVFEDLGGFAQIDLMEDIELSRRLKRQGRPACLRATVVTSSRRWEERGILKTVLLMWRLRLAYFFGVRPERLSRHYH
jgi:rSAM/selenodomain-associated transferase 2